MPAAVLVAGPVTPGNQRHISSILLCAKQLIETLGWRPVDITVMIDTRRMARPTAEEKLYIFKPSELDYELNGNDLLPKVSAQERQGVLFAKYGMQ
jgi:hypothetical protein